MRNTFKQIKVTKKVKFQKKKTFKKSQSTHKRKTLRKRKYIKGGETYVCAICLEEFTNPNDNITLQCGHIFHEICMTSVCKASLNKRTCLCPFCRKELKPEEMKRLGFSPTQPQYVERFHNTEDVLVYINRKLMAPTKKPFDKLIHVLSEFGETDDLPSDFIGGIMEFELQHVYDKYYRYRFTGIVENIPIFRLNKKYIEYAFDEDGIATDILEY
jgi:hypothetical protein